MSENKPEIKVTNIKREQVKKLLTPLFYKDASAIVYMAKNFGVKFFRYEQEEHKGWYEDKYYRHDYVPSHMPNTDCVYEVKGKKEDSFIMIDGHSLGVKRNYAAFDGIYVHPDSLDIFNTAIDDVVIEGKIYCRNGKAFIPPMSKAESKQTN